MTTGGAAAFTAATTLPLLAVSSESDGYAAVIVWLPALSAAVLNDATPLLLTGTCASTLLPSLNVRTSSGGDPAGAGVTVAVNVTDCPGAAGFGAAATCVVEALECIFCAIIALPALKPLPPLYTAVMKWLPAGRLEVVNVATPPLSTTLEARVVVFGVTPVNAVS